MIPQTKIEQAAKEAYNNGYPKDITPHYAGFTAGVRFAEAEMKQTTISPDVKQNLFKYFDEQHGVKLLESDFHEVENYMKSEVQQIAQEFKEWSDCHDYSQYSTLELEYLETCELFAKFMAERGRA